MDEYKLYIGTKIIKAIPMNKHEFLEMQGLPSNVQDKDLLGYKVIYDNDYASWSPKNVFESAYRLITDSEKELLK